MIIVPILCCLCNKTAGRKRDKQVPNEASNVIPQSESGYCVCTGVQETMQADKFESGSVVQEEYTESLPPPKECQGSRTQGVPDSNLHKMGEYDSFSVLL